MLKSVITALYSMVGVVIVVNYIPQIVAIARDKTGAQAISFVAWIMWTLTSFITVLYAWVVVTDWLLTLVSFANFLGCASISILAIIQRYRYKHRGR